MVWLKGGWLLPQLLISVAEDIFWFAVLTPDAFYGRLGRKGGVILYQKLILDKNTSFKRNYKYRTTCDIL